LRDCGPADADASNQRLGGLTMTAAAAPLPLSFASIVIETFYVVK
jgi:hypothetical protein